MNIMKPIPSSGIPEGDEWLYEVKYDGFRCVLNWSSGGEVTLISKRDKDLTANFPEIIAACRRVESAVKSLLPVKLDGELVVLNNSYQANFSLIQKRGRLKNKDSIEKAAASRPAALMIFDLLELKGKSLTEIGFMKRKKQLEYFFEYMEGQDHLKKVQAYENSDVLRSTVFHFKGEGIIAKRNNSLYQTGKKHRDWFKVKNWRTIEAFLIAYDPENGYFSAGVFENGEVKEIGKCKHGLDTDAQQTLKQLFLSNGEKAGDIYQLPPAICAKIHTLDLFKNELREPEFAELLPHTPPEECTMEKINLDMAMIPESVDVSNIDKVFWPEQSLKKGNLLVYMREVAPYMLPFLRDRALTLIRCPDGVLGEHFFQKHLPDYAPDFIPVRGDKVITCGTIEALLWFANHGAIEYHIPFQQIDRDDPTEIVFDLDPPDRDHFHLAIKAARLIKILLDDLELISFVKTSGNKGLQIHIPIPDGSMSYEETAVFTEAIASALENTHPDLFTTERFKNKRNGRLYLDHVQHAKDKTIIAPYSPRKTDDATVAMPLFWEEITENLNPTQFTIENAIERIQTIGCPFLPYSEAGEKQKLDKTLELIK